jgi:hypothetical protein
MTGSNASIIASINLDGCMYCLYNRCTREKDVAVADATRVLEQNLKQIHRVTNLLEGKLAKTMVSESFLTMLLCCFLFGLTSFRDIILFLLEGCIRKKVNCGNWRLFFER